MRRDDSAERLRERLRTETDWRRSSPRASKRRSRSSRTRSGDIRRDLSLSLSSFPFRGSLPSRSPYLPPLWRSPTRSSRLGRLYGSASRPERVDEEGEMERRRRFAKAAREPLPPPPGERDLERERDGERAIDGERERERPRGAL